MPPGLNSPAIKKAAIQTTGFLVANCRFYVNPTTSSLKQNKDPWTKVEWCPMAQVHYASKGFPTEPLESAPPCFKEDTGGPPGPPSKLRAYLFPHNSSPLSLFLCGWEHSWRQVCSLEMVLSRRTGTQKSEEEVASLGTKSHRQGS